MKKKRQENDLEREEKIREVAQMKLYTLSDEMTWAEIKCVRIF